MSLPRTALGPEARVSGVFWFFESICIVHLFSGLSVRSEIRNWNSGPRSGLDGVESRPFPCTFREVNFIPTLLYANDPKLLDTFCADVPRWFGFFFEAVT